VAVLWYKMVYCQGYKFSDLKRTMKRVFVPRTICGLFLAALGMFYVINFLLLLFNLIWPSAMEEYSNLIESAGLDDMDWKMIVLTVVMAPINEECIMRGIIFTKLKDNLPSIAAILISALYFGIFHLNVVQGTYAALLGIFMAYLAYKYKSIVAPMLFHAMFNGLNYLLVLLPTWVQESVVLDVIIPLACGVAWFFLEWKRKIADIE